MSFALTELEEQVRATAQKLARERLPVGELRALRDRRDAIGFSRERWRELARLGLAGATVGETWGGAGLGWAAFGLVLEECGRTLAPLPWLSTVLCAGAIEAAGTDEQRRALLPAMCAGEKILAFAHDEGARHSRHTVATRAERAPGGFRLHGEKTMVAEGHVADALVVSARVGGEPGLFLVGAGAPGLTVERLWTVDSRGYARVKLDGVSVGEADALGRPGADTGALVDALLDRATIALSAEMLGGLEEVFERTLQYLKTRTQFGVPIGSFQALQHRCALAWCEVELSRAVVREALVAADERRDDVALLACAAKARVSDAFMLCAAEAIQMHGGIGVTDELDIGLFYKRARVAQALLGDAAWHRDRFARLKGY